MIEAESINLVEQRRFNWFDFLRIGPEIKREQTRDQSLHLAGADVIRQSHLLANTNEKARTEIAARFVDQLECMSIFVEHIDPAVANHDYALRFLFIAFDNLCFRNRCWRPR